MNFLILRFDYFTSVEPIKNKTLTLKILAKSIMDQYREESIISTHHLFYARGKTNILFTDLLVNLVINHIVKYRTAQININIRQRFPYCHWSLSPLFDKTLFICMVKI